MITLKRLKELFEYNPDTGEFVRLISIKGGNRQRGELAGCRRHSGHRVIRIDGRLYRCARLAWFYMTGEWPMHTIDHKDPERPFDDRWDNLRAATQAENVRNRRVPTNNTSGFKGVSFSKRLNKWQAQIQINRKNHHLGYFATAYEAYEIYRQVAEVELSSRNSVVSETGNDEGSPAIHDRS